MKINYKNTALGLLDDPKNWPFYLAKDGQGMTEAERIGFGKSIRTAFFNNGLSFKDNIRYISESFSDAYIKTKSKLGGIIFNEKFEESGTLIFKRHQHTITTFYMLITEGVGEDWKVKVAITQFSKYSKNDFINLDVCITWDDMRNIDKEFIWKGFIDQGLDSSFFVSELLGLLCFIKYCEVETKVIKGGRRDHHAGVKYVNETKQNVKIYDSTWFTTLIKSEGFKVGAETGGFFRLQPYGPNNSQRKLIWVMPFEKHGYTRTAKVLNQNLSNKNE